MFLNANNSGGCGSYGSRGNCGNCVNINLKKGNKGAILIFSKFIT